MTKYHGVDITDEFLDQLWVAICDYVPDNEWIPITKNHEIVVAGIKHFSDMARYGAGFDLSFNKDYTKFKKNSPIKKNENLKRITKQEE